MKKTPVAIIGSGNSGLAMGAYLSANNHSVRLWNRSSETIQELCRSKTIKCSGVINKRIQVDVVTTDIEETLCDTELIMVTTPASAHREIAEKIAPYLKEKTMIVLNPGRTFGALEFINVLKKFKAPVLPIVAETQTIIYTCRKTGPDRVSILEFKKDVLLAAYRKKYNNIVMNNLPTCLQHFFIPAESIIETSIGNVGMILHCAPILLNIGWIESPKTKFKYYYEGITPSIAAFLEELDSERVYISELLGKRVEYTADWLRRSYNVSGSNLYECIQNNKAYKTIDAPLSLQHRYILEDVPCGLVPLEAVGRKLGLPVRLTSLIIDLASYVYKKDFRSSGRTLENLGLEKKSINEIKEIFFS